MSFGVKAHCCSADIALQHRRRRLVVKGVIADRLRDPAQQFQHAIVDFVFGERLNNAGGIFKMVVGVCHVGTMPRRSAIGKFG